MFNLLYSSSVKVAALVLVVNNKLAAIARVKVIPYFFTLRFFCHLLSVPPSDYQTLSIMEIEYQGKCYSLIRELPRWPYKHLECSQFQNNNFYNFLLGNLNY